MISLVKFSRQHAGLTPEDKHHILRCTKRRVPEESCRLCREEIWIAECWQLLLERLPVRPDAQVDVFPVVEAGPLHLALVERKAERLDEMHGSAGGQARSARVSGIPVNLWVHEYDVCRQCVGALEGPVGNLTHRR